LRRSASNCRIDSRQPKRRRILIIDCVKLDLDKHRKHIRNAANTQNDPFDSRCRRESRIGKVNFVGPRKRSIRYDAA
jgi:hypothetical protein